MKISQKQIEEIEFLELYNNFKSTEEEKEEYIQITVYGKGSGTVDIKQNNRLLIAKRSLDIMIKMWRKDLTIGLISKDEFMNDEWGRTEYFQKLLKSILKSVTKEYRMSEFEKLKYIDENGNTKYMATALAYSNFL